MRLLPDNQQVPPLKRDTSRVQHLLHFSDKTYESFQPNYFVTLKQADLYWKAKMRSPPELGSITRRIKELGIDELLSAKQSQSLSSQSFPTKTLGKYTSIQSRIGLKKALVKNSKLGSLVSSKSSRIHQNDLNSQELCKVPQTPFEESLPKEESSLTFSEKMRHNYFQYFNKPYKPKKSKNGGFDMKNVVRLLQAKLGAEQKKAEEKAQARRHQESMEAEHAKPVSSYLKKVEVKRRQRMLSMDSRNQKMELNPWAQYRSTSEFDVKQRRGVKEDQSGGEYS